MKKKVIFLLIILLLVNNFYLYSANKKYKSYYTTVHYNTINEYYNTFEYLNFSIHNSYKNLSYDNLVSLQNYMDKLNTILHVGIHNDYYFNSIYMYLSNSFNYLHDSYMGNGNFTDDDNEYYNKIKESIELIDMALKDTFYLTENGEYNFTSYETVHLDEIMPRVREKLSRGE